MKHGLTACPVMIPQVMLKYVNENYVICVCLCGRLIPADTIRWPRSNYIVLPVNSLSSHCGCNEEHSGLFVGVVLTTSALFTGTCMSS